MKNKAAAAEGVRILLIEDNDADVDLMRYALDTGRFRYTLTTLTDGEEALAFSGERASTLTRHNRG